MLAEKRNTPDFRNPMPHLKSDETPIKNPLCPYYHLCLDQAVNEEWRQFTCIKCSFQDLHVEIKSDNHEARKYYNLLERVFGIKRQISA